MSEFEDIITRLGTRYKDLVLDPSGESADKFITTQADLKLYDGKAPGDWELVNTKTKGVTLVKDVEDSPKKLIVLEFLDFYNSVKKEIQEKAPIENLKAGGFESHGIPDKIDDDELKTLEGEENKIIEMEPDDNITENVEVPHKDYRKKLTPEAIKRGEDYTKKHNPGLWAQNEEHKARDEAEKLAKLDAIMNGEVEQPIKEPSAITHSRKPNPEHKMPAVIPVEMRNKQIVDLTPEDIINFICPKANMQEAMMFLKLCQARGINPFIKEAYLVKYKQDEPAQMVVSRDYFARKAEEHPQYDGNESGIIIKNEMGDLERREGTFILPDEKLVGGWCKVYRKDRSRPTISEVAFQEYAQKTREGALNKFWGGKPATMIRKVAFSQGHRDAFPGELSGLYDSAEIGDGAIEAEWEEVQA